jgi:hypothetical protein
VLGIGLLACLVRGIYVAAVTPPFQTPDEYGHYDYVLYLSHIDWGRFLVGDVARPVGYNDVTTDELWAVTRATGTESHLRGQGLPARLPTRDRQLAAGAAYQPSDSHQALSTKVVVAPQFNYPILYYGAAALMVKGLRVATSNPVAAYYLVRSASLVFALVTVWLTWLIAGAMFGPEDWLPAAFSVAFVALQPQLGMLGSSVQSDVLTVTLTTLAGYVAVRYAQTPTRRLAITQGAVIGLLLLTKLHAAAAAAAAFAVLVAWPIRRPEHVRSGLINLAVTASIAAVVGLWWYVRAYVLFGSAVGMVGDFKTAGFAGPRHNVRVWLAQWRLTYDSFWGMWGWLEVPLPGAYYAMLSWLSAISLVPLVRLPSVTGWRGPALAVVYWVALVTAYAGVMGAVAAFVGPVHNNQGRHWLPIVAAVALLLGHAGAALAQRSRALGYVLLALWCLALSAANARLTLDTSTFYGGYGL